MAMLIKQNESTASKAVVYLWCLGSDWSSAATHEAGGQPTFSIGGLPAGNTSNTLVDVKSANGVYGVALSASDVSVLGQGVVQYSSTTVPNAVAAFEVVAFDPFAALSVFSSGDSVLIQPGTYSGVTVGINDIALGSYSGVTVGVDNIAAGAYSGVTIGGLESGVTIADGGIVATSIASAAIEAVGINATANNAIADALLARNVAGGSSTGRVVKEALYALRNKVAVNGSTITVFGTDDTTSAWTGSISTAATTVGLITTVDPA